MAVTDENIVLFALAIAEKAVRGAGSYLPFMTVVFELLEGMKIAELLGNHVVQRLLSQNLIPEFLEKVE